MVFYHNQINICVNLNLDFLLNMHSASFVMVFVISVILIFQQLSNSSHHYNICYLDANQCYLSAKSLNGNKSCICIFNTWDVALVMTSAVKRCDFAISKSDFGNNSQCPLDLFRTSQLASVFLILQIETEISIPELNVHVCRFTLLCNMHTPCDLDTRDCLNACKQKSQYFLFNSKHSS